MRPNGSTSRVLNFCLSLRAGAAGVASQVEFQMDCFVANAASAGPLARRNISARGEVAPYLRSREHDRLSSTVVILLASKCGAPLRIAQFLRYPS
jgi:hypothetical protein